LIQRTPVSDALSDLGESEDAAGVIVPPPEPAAFTHRPAPRPRAAPALYARLNFRRTMIPILLTMGLALPACAIWWCFLDEDSPLKSLSIAYPITLAVVGIALLALGIANMLQVRARLMER
jgi:hypothetical protein